jgi:hypothetical protein
MTDTTRKMENKTVILSNEVKSENKQKDFDNRMK